MYLTEQDYKKQITVDQLTQVTQNDPLARQDAELTALEEMQSYLRSTPYDVAATFALTGADRNPLITMFLVDMTLYHLHSAVAPRNIPTVRITRYEAATAWLKSVQAGKLSPNLPLTPPPTDGTPVQENTFRVISQKRQNWYY